MDKFKLHGTHVTHISLDEILPLKKYNFHGHTLYGPNKFNTMINFYGHDCVDIVKLKRGWEKDKIPFKYDNNKHFIPWSYELDINDINDKHFCTENTAACIHSEKNVRGGLIEYDGFLGVRKCCYNKKNKILIDTCELLEKNGIKYFIYWGTLLGAIRNEQSIPWDIDHNIYVIGDDFNKLGDILNKLDQYNIGNVNKGDDKRYLVHFSGKNRIHLNICKAEYLSESDISKQKKQEAINQRARENYKNLQIAKSSKKKRLGANLMGQSRRVR